MVAAHSSFSQSVAVVDLNNGTQTGNGIIRQVLATPTGPGAGITAMLPQTRRPLKESPIDKVFLKAVSKEISRMLRLSPFIT